MYKLDFWEANASPEDVVWEVCDMIFTGGHPGAPGASNIDFTRALAIPVAQGGVRRHRQILKGKPIFALGAHGAS